MSAEEREETGELLQRIVGDRTIVVIEHDMEFMRTYADFVTVMHAGTVLAEGTVAEIQADPKVQEVYLGTRDGGGTRMAEPMLELRRRARGLRTHRWCCSTST